MGVVIQIPCNNSPSVNFVESVTGDGVDNTDPLNPILSFPDADEVDDTSTTSKFATQAQLNQIATNESDITNLETNALTSVSTDATLTGSGTAIDPLSVVPTSSGVQSVTGDGVGGTASDPVLTFPDADEVDDSTTTNKFVTASQLSLINSALQTGNNVSQLINDVGYITASSLPPSFNVDLDSAEASVARAVSGGRTTFTITHSLNTLDLQAQVFRLSDGRGINWRVERTGVNTIDASRAGTVANGLFRILIQG